MSLPNWASDYVGIEFKELGRNIEKGVDCWGLCQAIWDNQYDLKVPSYTSEYDKIDSRSEVITNAINEGIEDEWVKVDEAQTGDGIVFEIYGKVFHIGVVLSDRKFIHVFRGINACIEDYTSKRWEQRVEGFYRHQSRV